MKKITNLPLNIILLASLALAQTENLTGKTAPEIIQRISGALFSFEEAVIISYFIIIIMTWLILLLILTELLKIIPLFTNLTSWISAIIIDLLFGVSGAIKTTINFLFGFTELLEFTNASQFIKISIVIALVIIIGLFILVMVRKIRWTIQKDKIEREGFEAGAQTSYIKEFLKSFTK